MANFLKKAVVPFSVSPQKKVKDALFEMSQTAFQGKNLGLAVEIWKDMLKKGSFVFFGLAGAMVPAGMRRLIVFLIENRFIDCIVSTGANLFHDIHETLGNKHWQGTCTVDDVKLRQEGIDRIYDVFASDKEFTDTNNYIAKIARTFDMNSPLTTREFFFKFGERLDKDKREAGIITSAYKKNLPIYCPAIGDSSISLAFAANGIDIKFDVVKDVRETADMVLENRSTGVIYIGGGTPKNFIQQTEVTVNLLTKKPSPGHKFALQITSDAPHWGGLSGCTFEEAQSWGKVSAGAKRVTVYADATIALPLIVCALADELPHNKKERGGN